MGLKVSHGAFEASCRTFNVFRRFVCRSIGGSYPPHEKPGLDGDRWYWDPNGPFSSKTHEGMKEFLSHSDSEGTIAPEWCEVIADDLETALPYIAALEEKRARIWTTRRNGWLCSSYESIHRRVPTRVRKLRIARIFLICAH